MVCRTNTFGDVGLSFTNLEDLSFLFPAYYDTSKTGRSCLDCGPTSSGWACWGDGDCGLPSPGSSTLLAGVGQDGSPQQQGTASPAPPPLPALAEHLLLLLPGTWDTKQRSQGVLRLQGDKRFPAVSILLLPLIPSPAAICQAHPLSLLHHLSPFSVALFLWKFIYKMKTVIFIMYSMLEYLIFHFIFFKCALLRRGLIRWQVLKQSVKWCMDF